MNRLGHTPTLLIIPIALILIVGTIVSFVFANKPVDSFSNEIGQDLRNQAQYESYIREAFQESVAASFASGVNGLSESSLKNRFQKQVALRDYGLVEAGNFFLVVKRGDVIVKEDSGVWTINVNGIFVSKSSTAMDLTHWFNATAVVSSDGKTQYIYK